MGISVRGNGCCPESPARGIIITGDVQTIAILREDRDALQQRVEELEARIALREREYLEAPIETD